MNYEVDNILLEYEIATLKYQLFLSKSDYMTENMNSNVTVIMNKAYQLYTEATEGILEKFKKWVSNIIKAIFGNANKNKQTDKSNDEKVEIKSDPKAVNKFADGILKGLHDIFSSKEGITKVSIGGIALAGGISAAIVAIKKHFKIDNKDNKTTITVEEAKKQSDDLTKKASGIKAHIDQLKSGSDAETDTIKEQINLAQIALNEINASIKSINEALNATSGKSELTNEELRLLKGIVSKVKTTNTSNTSAMKSTLSSMEKFYSDILSDEYETNKKVAKEKAKKFASSSTDKEINTEIDKSWVLMDGLINDISEYANANNGAKDTAKANKASVISEYITYLIAAKHGLDD